LCLESFRKLYFQTATAVERELQSTGNSSHEAFKRVNGNQADKLGAIRKVVLQVVCGLDSQACFAATARPNEGYEGTIPIA
jgi:hypothetical protein